MRCRTRWTAWALALATWASSAVAGIDSDSVRLAATGQYGALEQLLEAQAARQKLGTRDLHALCFAYSKTKRYDRLFDCLAQLEKQIAAGDKRTRLFGLDDATPSLRLMRAEALLEWGDYQGAIAQANGVLDWIEEEDSNDRDFALQALATLVLANTLVGERAEAERQMQVLAGMATTFPLFDDYTPDRVFALARGHVALGQYAQAAALLEGDHYFRLRSWLDQVFSGAALQGLNYWAWAELPRAYLLAKCRLELGRWEQAQADIDRLLAIPVARNNGEIYWLMLYDRGRIAEHQGDLAQAAKWYRQAIDVIERQRATIHTEINKIGFAADKQAVYAALVRVSVNSAEAEQAFEAVERSKSRALIDLLAGKNDFGPDTAAALAPLTQEENTARLQLAGNAPEGLRAIAQVQAVQEQLRQQHPGLAALVTATPTPAATLQKRLGADETLVEYYRSGDTLLAFVVDRQHVRAVPLDGRGLEQDVRALRLALAQPPGSTNGLAPLARQLYQRLLAPLQPQLTGRSLLLVPHGVLHYLPFALLDDGQGPLVRNHSLRTLPSSSVLVYLQPTPAARSQAQQQPLLILGNPDLGQARLDLPQAQREAEQLAALWPQHQLLLRAQASEAAFKAQAPHYPYLHLASHGQFNAKEPLASRLLLHASAGEDGALTVDEIYRLRLDADLLVLSACETGLGGYLDGRAGGDDLIGLSRAFIFAGTRSIVASLWEVDDASTATLMLHFYRALAAGKTKAQALQEAQNQLRQSQPHPFYWAAFYLTGNR